MSKWLFLIMFFIPVLFIAQDASRWGMAFDLGRIFNSTDSLVIAGDPITEVDTSDVVYSDAQEINEYSEGIYHVVFYVDSVDATSDSINVDVRFGYKFTNSVVKWDSWINLFANKTVATLYDTSITVTNCTWWKPASFRQYRVYRSDTAKDTLDIPYVTDYLR